MSGGCSIASLNLAVHFLCHTYLRVRAKEESRLSAWIDLINSYSLAYEESAIWLIDYWASEDGIKHIRPFLLECPTRGVRHHFSRLLESSLKNFFHHAGKTVTPSILITTISFHSVIFLSQTHSGLSKLVESLLSMLDKDVPDNCKTCPQFFHLLSAYAKMVRRHSNGVQ